MPSQECYRRFRSPSNLSSIKCPTSLSLKSVNLNGELIEYFLFNCPNLEQLWLDDLDQIVDLNVSRPAVQLKHLETIQCKFLESLEFYAQKLVTFNYLSQIGTLKLHICLKEDLGEFPDFREFPQVPELTKLKHLMLEVDACFLPIFPGFTSLVDAAPSLQKFTFKFLSNYVSRIILSNTLTSHPRECLKDVDICGFVDRKFVMYLLQIAINLDKITIYPFHPWEYSEKYETSEDKEE
ncbi:hypothetical protein Vadar_034351 [Vaccinium darrowii]|uniref:Uncharacterized protein n=1 Tax=Vaccinium darrowii TaxID=229202 RepID=A0ACB7Y4H0_9ERIC|nr:hypothetical protein Vadar_034351 [Vaccinium darrowii]